VDDDGADDDGGGGGDVGDSQVPVRRRRLVQVRRRAMTLPTTSPLQRPRPST